MTIIKLSPIILCILFIFSCAEGFQFSENDLALLLPSGEEVVIGDSSKDFDPSRTGYSASIGSIGVDGKIAFKITDSYTITDVSTRDISVSTFQNVSVGDTVDKLTATYGTKYILLENPLKVIMYAFSLEREVVIDDVESLEEYEEEDLNFMLFFIDESTETITAISIY
jgi:hypothetical protein